MTTFTFGVEIECFLPEGATRAAAALAISQRGITAKAQDWNHDTQSFWKLVTDRSLGDMTRGMEVVSPILSGEAGLTQLVNVMEALEDFGCSVRKTCGFHVHIGVGHPPIEFFRNLTKLYSHFEGVIDGFMPPSRRDRANDYCTTIKNTEHTAIDRATSLHEIIYAIHRSNHAMAERYYKLNLTSYRKYSTVEFRQHSATLEGKKAANWVSLCLKMVAAAMAGRTGIKTSAAPVAGAQTNKARAGSKAKLVGDLMMRPEGVTSAEAIAATGWPSISLPQQAAACGLTFTARREGRQVRYFVTTTTTTTTTIEPATLGDFLAEIEADDAERAYYERRTRNLSGRTDWQA